MEPNEIGQRPVFVLDSNCWIATWLLKSSIGREAIFHIQAARGLICLPQVVEIEVCRNIVRRASEEGRRLDASVSCLAHLLPGYEEETPPAPEEADIAKAVEERFEQMAPLLQRVPVTAEHALAALKMVLDESPPNGPKNQQFKDCLVWEAALSMPAGTRVYLVTEDKGFFEGREPKKGLARSLAKEAVEKGLGVEAHSTLAGCLSQFGTAVPPLDWSRTELQLRRTWLEHAREEAQERGHVLGKPAGVDFEPLFGSTPDSVPIQFELRYGLLARALSEADVSGGMLVLKGEATYSIPAGRLVKTSLGSCEFRGITGVPFATLYCSPPKEK